MHRIIDVPIDINTIYNYTINMYDHTMMVKFENHIFNFLRTLKNLKLHSLQKEGESGGLSRAHVLSFTFFFSSQEEWRREPLWDHHRWRSSLFLASSHPQGAHWVDQSHPGGLPDWEVKTFLPLVITLRREPHGEARSRACPLLVTRQWERAQGWEVFVCRGSECN